jgi:hypothetical protein
VNLFGKKSKKDSSSLITSNVDSASKPINDLHDEVAKMLLEFAKNDDENNDEDDEESDDQRFVGNLKYKEEVKKDVIPDVKKRRDLDIETGGLEEGKKGVVDIVEIQKEIKDVWDNRSEEVDKMGSTDTFNTTGMKSVVWKQKHDRLTHKKNAKRHKEAAGATAEHLSFGERIKLREDRSHEDQNSGGHSL